MPSSARATLAPLIYNPIWGNYPHWALRVTVGDGTSYCLQILGEPGSFQFDETIGTDPIVATRRKNIQIWQLDSEADVERVREVVRNMRIDNETVHWNCQDWCMDVIAELEDDLVVGVQDDGDEEDLLAWKKLKKRLLKEIGPDL